MIVGIGNLGQALASYGGFSARGFRIAALLDADPKKTGLEVGNLKVRPTGELSEIVQKHAVAIGIIATPGHAAQTVADQMVEAGIASILNFSPSVINVPDSVAVRRVDLAVELQILSFYQHHRDDEPIPTVAVVPSVSVADGVPRPAAAASAGSSARAGARDD